MEQTPSFPNYCYEQDIITSFSFRSKSLNSDFEVCIYTNDGVITGGYCAKPNVVACYNIFELNSEILIDLDQTIVILKIEKSEGENSYEFNLENRISSKIRVISYTHRKGGRVKSDAKTITVEGISFGSLKTFNKEKVSNILTNIIKRSL